MILKNYWNWNLCAAKGENGGGYSIKLVDVKATDGTEPTNYAASQSTNYGPAKSGLSCLVGTGNTAPDAEDYALDADITASLTDFAVAQTMTANPEGDGFSISFLVSGTNNTGSAITIKEIGVIKSAMTTGGDSYDILMARQLLTDPITVADGAGFSYAFRWSEA